MAKDFRDAHFHPSGVLRSLVQTVWPLSDGPCGIFRAITCEVHDYWNCAPNGAKIAPWPQVNTGSTGPICSINLIEIEDTDFV